MTLVVSAIYISSIQARDNSSQALPETALPKIIDSEFRNNFAEIGNAKFSVLFWDIYTSKLFTTSGQYPANNNHALLFEIQYLRAITKQQLIENTQEQWLHLGLNPNQFEHYLAELTNIWPDIEQGDVLSLLVQNHQSYFYFNQQLVGSISERDFGEMFLSIWLADNTSQPKLRRRLLGVMAK